MTLDTFKKDELLANHSTLGIGGPAKYFVEVKTAQDLLDVLKIAKQHHLKTFVLGRGSNCLFDDRGFNGIVILNKIDFFEQSGSTLHVGAGYNFSLLGTQTARLGLSGLEFASGIPGSVGGAVFMNAGANGKETCECLVSVDYVTDELELVTLQRKDLAFSYRTSPFQKMSGVIVGATYCLRQEQEARQKQLEIISYRKKTQPLQEMSAGCIFRNPPSNSAGALIDQSGLKGIEIGDAKVSEIHANFLINKGHATAADFLKLIHNVKEKVKEKSGIDLESEVRYISYE